MTEQIELEYTKIQITDTRTQPYHKTHLAPHNKTFQIENCHAMLFV